MVFAGMPCWVPGGKNSNYFKLITFPAGWVEVIQSRD